jgi:hypothetical protein
MTELGGSWRASRLGRYTTAARTGRPYWGGGGIGGDNEGIDVGGATRLFFRKGFFPDPHRLV